MSDTPETNAQELVHSVSGAKLHCVDVEFARKLERERNRLRVTLEEIASLDTSQDASPQQCGAVLIAMNVLNK
jgi:hypothetical protein